MNSILQIRNPQSMGLALHATTGKDLLMSFRIVLLLSLLLTLLTGLRAEQLPVKTYTTADGLGSSYISNLMRDSHGFMWFCTRDGLSRFDGSRFVTYQVGDRNAPPGIEQILETRAGIYWIVTTGGLYRFDPNVPIANNGRNATRPTLNAELMGEQRGTLYEDRRGNLWSGGGGLYLLEERGGKVYSHEIELNLPLKPSVQFNISEILEGQDGSLWLVTTWGLVRRLPDGREIFYSAGNSPTDFLSSGIEDRAGRIWLAHAAAIYILKPEPPQQLSRLGPLTVRKLDDSTPTRARQKVSLPELPGEIYRYADVRGFAESHSKYLYETTDGHVWISVNDGLVEYDGQTFIPHTSAQGLLKSSGVIAEDTSGNLWMGWGTGLMRLDRHGLTTYNAADELKDLSVLAIGESLDGKLYVGANEFILSQFDGHSFQTIHPPLPSDEAALWLSRPVFQDHAGEWWFLTNKKLYRFAASQDFNSLARGRPRAVYTSRDGLKADQMFCIFEDSKGDLWISARGPDSAQIGLSRWNRATEKFETFSRAEGFPPDKSPSSFAEDRNGSLWFGFYSGGLARYAQGRFTEFTTTEGAPVGVVTALHSDRQGRLWVASSLGGLGRVDDTTAVRPRFINYTTDSGLASNNVRSLTEDLYGNIYAGTARGVDRLSPDATRIHHYSVKDGLAGDFVNVSFRDRAGTLWFGTPNGLSRLVPEAGTNTNAPPVWLGGLRIAGESRPLPELGSAEILGLDLSPSQNNLQIDFFGIDFSAGEALRYQYFLEGADKDWSAPTIERTVNYAQLAPGKYRFLVRALNADGVASQKPAEIAFTIHPPIWQRWWFIGLVVMSLAGIAYAMFRYRLTQLLKVERVRSRIATDLHDDIGASLSRMAIISEVVKQQTTSEDNQSAGLLTDIADSARGLVDSMGDIVWSIDPRRDNLQSAVRRIRQFASDVLEAKGINWELRVPEEVETLKLSPDQRRHLFLIFKEGINNIARHGNGTTSVSLSIKVEGRQLVGEIIDDGCGFTLREPDAPRSRESGGNGLPNMQSRAEQMGGRLEISSAPGKGTHLILRAPIK